MEIVDLDGADRRAPEPPMWLIAIAMCAALAVGLARSSEVSDPRVAHRAAPTPCIPHAVQASGFGYVWSYCP